MRKKRGKAPQTLSRLFARVIDTQEMAPTTRLTAPEEFSPRIKFPTQICAACGQPGSLRCAKCRSSPYCSRECQKAHFKVHKTICDPAIDPKNAFLERLAAEIRANVKCSREVSPAVSTIIPRISALLATLSNRSLTAWFLPGEYRTLPAGHGFRLLATPNVLVGIAILASSPDRAFGAHIKPEHVIEPLNWL